MPPTRRRRSSRSPAPGAGVQRSRELPVEHANELLPGYKGKLHTVKEQKLKVDDNNSITICRVKVPTPKGVSGHLIRRLDTDAVSASSLFRAAFPQADEASEREEMIYVGNRYNTKVAGAENEDGTGRLTGTWIPTEDASGLANEYGILKFAKELIEYAFADTADTNGTISSPAAPTPRKAKSPAPTSRGKRPRITSPPVSTRSSTSAAQSLQAVVSATPSRVTRSKPAPPEVDVPAVSATPPEEEVGGIQVTQEIVIDETTNIAVEETTVTFTGLEAQKLTGDSAEGLIGTEEQAREAAEHALQLIENLKRDGTLQSSASKRHREEEEIDELDEDDEEEPVEKPGVFKRLFGRKKTTTQRTRKTRDIGKLQLMQSADGVQVLVAQSAVVPQEQANKRRYIAMAGMVVMGAATAAAPYIFG